MPDISPLKKRVLKYLGDAFDGALTTLIALALYGVFHSWLHVSVPVALIIAIGYLVTHAR